MLRPTTKVSRVDGEQARQNVVSCRVAPIGHARHTVQLLDSSRCHAPYMLRILSLFSSERYDDFVLTNGDQTT